MDKNQLTHLIPQHKGDEERAYAAIQSGYPNIEPILPELLGCIADYNWPIAQILAPFLASIGKPLIPHIRKVFDSNDMGFTYWIMTCLLQDSKELAEAFREELVRFAYSPTKAEAHEELDEQALKVLTYYGWNKT